MNNTGKAKDEGVSLGGTTGEWAPPESELTLRSDDERTEVVASRKETEPSTPRKASKRYPEEVRASLKALRKSLFAALKKKKKAQLDGIEYVRALLLNAESYAPLEPRSAQTNSPENPPEKNADSETAVADAGGIKEEIDTSPQKVTRYEDDGVKPHTRTQRSSTQSPMRTAPVETPSKKADPVTTNDTAKADAGKSVEVGKSPVKTKASYVIPANWHAKESASTGERYYFNSVTGESAWRHPGAPPDARDEEVTYVNALAVVDVLQRDMGVHVFKKELRPLLEFDGISQRGALAVETLLEALSEQIWLPTEEQISNDTGGELKRMRAEMEFILGSKLAAAFTDGQDLEYVKALLEQVQNDRTAVEELKGFLGGLTSPHDVEGTNTTVTSTGGMEMTMLKEKSRSMSAMSLGDLDSPVSSRVKPQKTSTAGNSFTMSGKSTGELPYLKGANANLGRSSPGKYSNGIKAYTAEDEKAEPGGQDGHISVKDEVAFVGVLWEEIGSQEPQTGGEIRSTQLETGLLKKLEFSTEELDGFSLPDLSYDSYIRVGSKYYKPALPPNRKPVAPVKDEIEEDIPMQGFDESAQHVEKALNQSHGQMRLTNKPKKGGARGLSPFLAKITKPIVKELSTNPPAVKKPFPIDQIPPPRHIAQRDPNFEWTPWTNPKTGKVHEPIPVPSKSRGSSRQRSQEFSKLMGDATLEERRRQQQDHEAFWKRAPSPAGPRVTAIEYKGWYHLDQPVPGWSPHTSIVSHPPASPWHEQKIDIPFKMGSRYAQRVGGLAPERLTCISMLVDNLKEERGRANFVLDGQASLKSVRTFVLQDAFDRAVKTADDALKKFKAAGKHGQLQAKEIRDAEGFVIKVIKHEMDRLLAFAKDSVERCQFDKASQQIPKLRKAARWLLAKGVVYPEAREPTQLEKRNGISRETFPVGMGVIDALLENIIKKAASGSLSLMASSLSNLFSSMRPELNLEDEATQELIKQAEQRRNQLPEEIITDGRTYVCVFDLKPSALPEKLKINQKVLMRGERVLASGETVEAGRDWMSGTITSWNQRAKKYKVQYEEDSEWLVYPIQKEGVEIELDLYPEDVVMSANGYSIRSITQEHPKEGRKVAIVAFTFVPLGGDLNLYGKIDISVKGAKSKKSLFAVGTESITVPVLPPEVLRPSTCYWVYDSVTHEALSSAVVEFIRQSDAEKFSFEAGQQVELEDGVYEMEVRGTGNSGYPWTSYHAPCVLVLGRTRGENNKTSRIFLNRHIHSPHELRIVLSWGASPLELDLHLYTSEGGHVEHKNAGKLVDGIKLEMDTSTGHGPETASIKVSSELGYSFSVFWPGEGGSPQDWTASLATVTLYDTKGPFAVFHSPTPNLGAKEEKWWHVFAFDGSQWNTPNHGIVRFNQRMASELPQLALQGWTFVESARKGLWDDFCSQIRDTLQGSPAETVGGSDDLCMKARRLALMTSLEGSTLLSLICAHDHDPLPGEDGAAGDENGRTPLQKQLDALHALFKGSVQLEKMAKSIAAMDGGIPHELALSKEIRMRGVRDTYIYRSVMYASTEVAVQVLGVLAPCVKRSSMSSLIREFFYTHAEELLELCVMKRRPPQLLPVLQALLAIDAVWERKPIRRFLQGDKVLVEWPQATGNWVTGVVHKCRYDVNVIRLDTDPEITTPGFVSAGCQWQPSDSGIVHDDLLKGKLVPVAPTRLKWTSPVLHRLKTLDDKYRREERQMNVGINGFTPAQRQIAKAAEVYKKAVKIMAEKAFVDDKDDKKRSAPNTGDVNHNE